MATKKKLEEFLAFSARHRLFEKGDRLLLAISGGVDSVAMGHLFFEAGLSFGVVHCNFKLRGDASDGDENFVAGLAAKWGVPFFSTVFETAEYAREHGISIQMAARELRYQFFEEVAEGFGFSAIATAHHVDDALETILLNLTHGTGFQGLAGITPRRERYIRPMLAFTGAELRQLAADQGIDWREDASNEKDDYERNRLRHHVLPVLEAINPALANTAKNTLERLWATGDELDRGLNEWQHSHVVVLQHHVEVALPAGSAVFLYEYLKRAFGLAYKSYKQMEEAMAGSASGKLFHTDTHTINVDRSKLVISPKKDGATEQQWAVVSESDRQVVINGLVLSCSWQEAPVVIEAPEEVAQLDADRLTFPLELRPWRQGDSFVPLGMKGQKKVSDFMIDAKIPVNLKSQVHVLVSAGEVVWVVGMRISDRFKITPSTQRVFRIERC